MLTLTLTGIANLSMLVKSFLFNYGLVCAVCCSSYSTNLTKTTAYQRQASAVFACLYLVWAYTQFAHVHSYSYNNGGTDETFFGLWRARYKRWSCGQFYHMDDYVLKILNHSRCLISVARLGVGGGNVGNLANLPSVVRIYGAASITERIHERNGN